MLHQTVAKGAGGEDWGKSIRDLLKETHVTADTVFRAVIENWESTVGYVGGVVDFNHEAVGGGRSQDDLSPWTGISAGIERLKGLLAFLAEYLKVETSTPVTIPLGMIADLIVRILSVSIPATETSKSREGPRLNPSVDKGEKDVLWSALPQIYAAALSVVEAMTDRLGPALVPLAEGFLNQIAWVFTYGKHSSEFRQATYHVVAKLLRLAGKGLNKAQVSKLNAIIRCCGRDLAESERMASVSSTESTPVNGSGQVVDNFLRQPNNNMDTTLTTDPALAKAAEILLPRVVACIPQHFLDITIRSLVERTAILTHNKEAMLECVLNTFVGKNGAPLPSIVPHLTQAFAHDSTVEILLRPRMPLIPASTTRYNNDSYQQEVDPNEEMEIPRSSAKSDLVNLPGSAAHEATEPSIFKLGSTEASKASAVESHAPTTISEATPEESMATNQKIPVVPSSAFLPSYAPQAQTSIAAQDTEMAEGSDDEDSDAGSVHLTMQLDSESDSDEET